MKNKQIQLAGVVFLISMILASLFVNGSTELFDKWGIFDYAFVKKCSQVDMAKKELFQYILWNKVKLWGIFVILMFSQIHYAVYLVYTAGLGCVLGVGNTIMILRYGMRGIWYFTLVLLLPAVFWQLSVTVAETFARNRGNGFGILGSWIFMMAGVAVETVANLIFLSFRLY